MRRGVAACAFITGSTWTSRAGDRGPGRSVRGTGDVENREDQHERHDEQHDGCREQQPGQSVAQTPAPAKSNLVMPKRVHRPGLTTIKSGADLVLRQVRS